MIVFLVFTMLIIPSYGESENSNEDGVVIQPYFTNIYSFYSYFDIDGNGKGMIDATLDGHGGDNGRIIAKLQRYRNGSWKTIKTYENTSTTSDCSLSKIHYVTKGYTYRVLFYGYIYNESLLLDYTNQTSSIRIY